MNYVSFFAPGKPVSSNGTYRFGSARMWKTKEATRFIANLQKWARIAMDGRMPEPAYVEVRITFIFADERPDLDGPLKTVLDALQGITYRNDRQVRSLSVQRRTDKTNPGVEITVSGWKGEAP